MDAMVEKKKKRQSAVASHPIFTPLWLLLFEYMYDYWGGYDQIVPHLQWSWSLIRKNPLFFFFLLACCFAALMAYKSSVLVQSFPIKTRQENRPNVWKYLSQEMAKHRRQGSWYFIMFSVSKNYSYRMFVIRSISKRNSEIS